MLRAVIKSAEGIPRKCHNASGEQGEIHGIEKVCYDKILCIVLKMARHALIPFIASYAPRYEIAKNVRVRFCFKRVNRSLELLSRFNRDRC